jgi:hypothetical protein
MPCTTCGRTPLMNHARSIAAAVGACALYLPGSLWGQWVPCASGSQTCTTSASVGIGTTSPGAKLDVFSSGTARVIAGDAWPSYPNVGGGIGLGISSFNSDGTNFSLSGDGNDVLLNAPNHNIYFRVANADKAIILANGNVGIGTTTPSHNLDIVGTTTATMLLRSAGATSLTALGFLRGSTEDCDLGTAGASGQFSDFAIQGDVILRASTSNLILSARDSAGAIRFGTGAADTEKMTITSAGNVGIGTTAPQHLLHVAGTIGAIEVIVSSTGADYVFRPDYRLRPLTEVASLHQGTPPPARDPLGCRGQGKGRQRW